MYLVIYLVRSLWSHFKQLLKKLLVSKLPTIAADRSQSKSYLAGRSFDSLL